VGEGGVVAASEEGGTERSGSVWWVSSLEGQGSLGQSDLER